MHIPYVLPKDANELERLNAQHHLMEMVLGASYLAPVEQPATVLDVACGTGIWPMEMAQAFPDAQVHGLDIDLSMLRRYRATLAAEERPRNVRWHEGNAFNPLPFISGSFDLVHLRFAATGLPFDRWPLAIAEMVRVTRPGGYVELVEGSMPQGAADAYTGICATFSQLLRQGGMESTVSDHLSGFLRQAGLVDVEERWFTTGETDEQQGILYETTRAGFHSLMPLLSQRLTPEDYATYCARVAEVEANPPQVTRRDVVVWGRKPIL